MAEREAGRISFMGNDQSPFLSLCTASEYPSLILLSDRGYGFNVARQQERRTSKQRLKQESNFKRKKIKKDSGASGPSVIGSSR